MWRGRRISAARGPISMHYKVADPDGKEHGSCCDSFAFKGRLNFCFYPIAVDRVIGRVLGEAYDQNLPRKAADALLSTAYGFSP